ncbi:endolytic transglycosylase MltG [Bifidobacterium bombi]|uniref:Endolytic murein transglycosylase n=1 Tax=Bifidobacterium bombi DSM 19703 TaxID=1341695 RepID=A0A080N600_9BIFI|nr:endolytic transglycosylase MltG [Bifidobacterium bombi]KFF31154.1 YceG family protein [Bifidobacterium bombi DSM 19703]
MSDDLADFFALDEAIDSQHDGNGPHHDMSMVDMAPDAGVADDGSRTHSQPAMTRRALRQRHRLQKKRRIIVCMIVAIALLLIGIAGFQGLSKLTHEVFPHDSTGEEVLDYPGPGVGHVRFEISSGESINRISSNLEKAGIVKSASAFASAVGANRSTLYPGVFDLKKRMSSAQVIEILSDQSKAGGVFQVKAGERTSQVFDEAAKASGIDRSEFQRLQQSGGSGVLPAEANGNFEGWLEPGAYLIDGKKSAVDVIKPAVDARIRKLDSLQVPAGEQRQRVLIIASIVESEVNLPEYYGKVSRVVLNRLNADMPLGMDSTVAYGLGIDSRQLTDAMLTDPSNPYNTRVNHGLPPTAISNPGDQAIEASMAPADGDWLYFVTTNLKTGETHFTDSEQEFAHLRDEYKRSNANAN